MTTHLVTSAARVAWTFQYVGHTNTALLEMTFSHWKNLGLETEKENQYFYQVKTFIECESQYSCRWRLMLRAQRSTLIKYW